MTVITTIRDEPVPGLTERILTHLKSSGIQAKQGVDDEEIEALSEQEIYDLCPAADLINTPPSSRDWETMRTYQRRLDQALDRKGMNEWAKNICLRIKDGKTKQGFWRAA